MGSCLLWWLEFLSNWKFVWNLDITNPLTIEEGIGQWRPQTHCLPACAHGYRMSGHAAACREHNTSEGPPCCCYCTEFSCSLAEQCSLVWLCWFLYRFHCGNASELFAASSDNEWGCTGYPVNVFMWNLSSFLPEGFVSGVRWGWWLEGKVCVSFSETANFPYVLPPPEHEGPGGSVSPWLRVPVGLVLLSLAGSPSSYNSGWLHFCWGFNWISPLTTLSLFSFLFFQLFLLVGG